MSSQRNQKTQLAMNNNNTKNFFAFYFYNNIDVYIQTPHSKGSQYFRIPKSPSMVFDVCVLCMEGPTLAGHGDMQTFVIHYLYDKGHVSHNPSLTNIQSVNSD